MENLKNQNKGLSWETEEEKEVVKMEENTLNQQLNNNESQSAPPQQISETAPSCKLPGFSYLFSKTFSVYKNNLWTFLVISAIPFTASFLLPRIFLSLMTKPSLGHLVLLIPIYLIMILISLWSSLSLLYAVKERDNKISIGGALGKGWSNLGSYVWVSFLISIIIIGGFILLIIPGIIFIIWFGLSLYVLVDENKKGIDALKRSKELISGYVTAFWGRTVLFGLIIALASFLFSFIIRIVSAFLPVLNYISIFIYIVTTPLSIIFSFLVYENIRKLKDSGCAKSPKEIKYILIASLLFLLPILGIFASIVLVSLNTARGNAKEARIMADMSQLRSSIEIYYYDREEGFSGVNCYSAELSSICSDIKEYAGETPTIKSSTKNYCLYVKLPSGKYYCLDNKIGSSYGTVTIFPGSQGYCNGITFNCP